VRSDLAGLSPRGAPCARLARCHPDDDDLYHSTVDAFSMDTGIVSVCAHTVVGSNTAQTVCVLFVDSCLAQCAWVDENLLSLVTK
jgi:hypothetical protein